MAAAATELPTDRLSQAPALLLVPENSGRREFEATAVRDAEPHAALLDFDLPPKHELREIAELAAEICGTPIGLVSSMGEHWQTVHAAVGLPATSAARRVPRELTMCVHTLGSGDLMVVDDTMDDVRFAGHPMVTGDPEIRFYAGLPLTAPGGEPFGTLCVVDVRPRTLTPTQTHALRLLGRQLRSRLDLLAQRRALQAAVAGRDEVAARLRSRERLFHCFMNNSPLLATMKDSAGRFVFVNRRVAERFAVSETAWLGHTDFDLFPDDEAQASRAHDLEVLATNRLLLAEETTTVGDLSTTWRSYKFPCIDEKGNRLVAGLSLDVTESLRQASELDEARHELERITGLDPLTGLATRYAFEENLDREFARALGSRETLSLLVLDPDHLRRRNERLGREAGDDALRTLGSLLRELCTEHDCAARLGETEFAVLLPATTAAEAAGLAKRLQAELRRADWGLAPVTVSVGISSTEHTRRSPRQLLCTAESSMYRAKDTGRDRVVVDNAR